MAGVMDFLDTLTTQVGQVAGQAVKSAGDVASATIAARAQDQTRTENTSALQSGGNTNVLPWVIGGTVLLIGAYLLLRK